MGIVEIRDVLELSPDSTRLEKLESSRVKSSRVKKKKFRSSRVESRIFFCRVESRKKNLKSSRVESRFFFFESSRVDSKI